MNSCYFIQRIVTYFVLRAIARKELNYKRIYSRLCYFFYPAFNLERRGRKTSWSSSSSLLPSLSLSPSSSSTSFQVKAHCYQHFISTILVVLASLMKTFILPSEERRCYAKCVIFKHKWIGKCAMTNLRFLFYTLENPTLPTITSSMPPAAQQSSTTHTSSKLIWVFAGVQPQFLPKKKNRSSCCHRKILCCATFRSRDDISAWHC